MIALETVLATVESDTRQLAIRFEDALFMRPDRHNKFTIQRIKAIHKISTATATMLYCTSFGLYQLMGFNLWGESLNYKGTFADFLNTTADQDAMLKKFLTTISMSQLTGSDLHDTVKREKLARYYNGSGNVPAYSAKLLDALVRLEG